MAIEAFLGTKPQKGFLGTIVGQALVVLAMVAIVYGKIEKSVDTNETLYKTIPCYLALFALAEVFEVIITVDALRLRNTIQLVGIILFHCAMIVMSVLQITQTREAFVGTGQTCDGYLSCDDLFTGVLPFLIIVPAVLVVSLIILVWTTRALFAEFGWAVFHAIGADPKMKSMYQYYQIMVCLLKFDFFCFTGVTMQLLILVIGKAKAEFGVTIAAIPIVLGLLILCGVALQREYKWVMLLSLTLMVCAESYFIFKLVRVFAPKTANQYSTTKGSIVTFLIASALLLLLTFAVGVRCFADFKKGLRQSKLADPEKPRLTKGSSAGTPGAGGKPGRRLSIE